MKTEGGGWQQRRRERELRERNSKTDGERQSENRRGREGEGGCTAMQTPFGVSRSARSPAMRVPAVCLDQAATDSPSFHNYMQHKLAIFGLHSILLKSSTIQAGSVL